MNYSVIYSKRKTISISIVKGEVLVKAPIRTSKKKIEEVIIKHKKWINKHLESQRRKNEMLGALTEDDISLLKREARKYFKDKIDFYSNLMGLKYSRMTITSAEKRFGSCSERGNICFSYRLMLYPEPAREYVVVHELAHLAEMNHSKKFYAIVEKVLPDYKERKRLLR